MSRLIKTSLVAFALLASVPANAQQVAAPKPAKVLPPHPTHGPHNGDLLEIGNHDYHAELCLNEPKQQVVVYLLDKDLKHYIAMDSPALMINLKIAGKPTQIKLAATPQNSDRSGSSSCFSVVSPELMSALHDARSDARLSLRIGEKAYVVKVVHHHDHAGHSHATQSTTPAPKRR
jgi:hypothetical protein